jgi:ADP-heptose:LPS heptosyltransferase
MHALVIRSSAMGDVILTVPVLKMVLRENPDLRITMITNELFKPFFNGIERLSFVCPDFKDKHKGIRGLTKFVIQLNTNHNFDVIIDLHSVLRSVYMRFLYKLKGVPIFSINKGREEKKRLIMRRKFQRLKHVTDRYIDVFKSAGLKTTEVEEDYIVPTNGANEALDLFLNKSKIKKKTMWIGIAPFAKHETKIWPTNNFYKLMEIINDFHEVKFFMFGGGEKEHIIINSFTKNFPNVVNMVGRITLKQEIALIDRLDFMITMDSANMHLASLLGKKVISIWGATHPYFGFSPVNQRAEFSIQIPLPDLKCRPCSVYGNTKCKNKSKFKCLYDITPDHVYEKLVEYGLLENKQFNEELQ